MLKILFSVLLLANAGLFAWQRGYLESLVPSGREPARMDNQINPDKLRLLPPPAPAEAAPAAGAGNAPSEGQDKAATPAQAPAIPAPVPAQPPASPAPASGRSNAPAPAADTRAEARTEGMPVPVNADAAAPAPQRLACTEIGDFDADGAKRFGARIAALDLGGHATRRPLQEVSSHVVYIPPQPDKEAVERKAGELRRLGVEDFFIILDNSPLRWGISLGVFKQESAAKAHLAALTERGVRSARIGQRMAPSGMFAFQFRKLDPAQQDALDRLRAGFPQQQQRACQD
ncbi:MAG TPA: SPOR domain-containing protein [Noviherbaspirillum sp.]|jgi:pyruvate/2-oxoglutarate dehydrogenase complex dihydrolipoamide acyltransferase (E2) component|uniref:SPOR domain-containing protein n=1 Tax=Noviherbaspirillum sp. TaxID=1926288 RepID=UPI002F938D5A